MNDRERWLVIEGFVDGFRAGCKFGWLPVEGVIREKAKDWLKDSLGDGVTVEMELDRDAPTATSKPIENAEEHVARLRVLAREPTQNPAITTWLNELADLLSGGKPK
jgi:hypothetical protein